MIYGSLKSRCDQIEVREVRNRVLTCPNPVDKIRLNNGCHNAGERNWYLCRATVTCYCANMSQDQEVQTYGKCSIHQVVSALYQSNHANGLLWQEDCQYWVAEVRDQRGIHWRITTVRARIQELNGMQRDSYRSMSTASDVQRPWSSRWPPGKISVRFSTRFIARTPTTSLSPSGS
jgi:hypothetical protein